MNTKHTPGPWRYEYEPGYCGQLISPDGITIASFVDEPRPYDANLIASAPDLLEALKKAEFVMDACPMVSQQLVAAVAKARAAIAKANGEQV